MLLSGPLNWGHLLVVHEASSRRHPTRIAGMTLAIVNGFFI